MMKKVVFAFSCYLPAKKYGGPLKSVYNLVESTSDEFDYYLISLDHDFQEIKKLPGTKPGWNKVGQANVMYLNEKDFSFDKIKSLMEECKAQLVYLCSVYYYQFNFPAVKVARELNIPVLLAPRSDLLPNCVHHKYAKKFVYLSALKIMPIYKGIYYHSTSDEETESILKWMNTDRKHIIQMPNIASCALNIERRHKKQGELQMVYIGRIHPRKNFMYTLEVLKQVNGKVSLDVYGSMEDSEYWKQCEEVIATLDEDKSVKYCGVLSPLEVQQKYYEYDALFFPTLNENYGHVIVEAIISGCVCVISKGTTPWDDYDHNGGYCIDLKDIRGFVVRIEELVNMDARTYARLSLANLKYAKNKFNNDLLCKRYKDEFKKLIGGK